MGYYCYYIMAHMGEKELPQGGSIYQICTELEIVLPEPDWEQALQAARQLAPGKHDYVIRKIVHSEPRLERPEHWPAPEVYGAARSVLDVAYADAIRRPAQIGAGLTPERDSFLEP